MPQRILIGNSTISHEMVSSHLYALIQFQRNREELENKQFRACSRLKPINGIR